MNRPDSGVDEIEPSGGDNDQEEDTETHEVYIMNPKHEDRASSFFAQPGVLAGKSMCNLRIVYNFYNLGKNSQLRNFKPTFCREYRGKSWNKTK